MAITRNGHRPQEALKQNPSLDFIRDCDRTYRGVIVDGGVLHKEITVRGARLNKTLLDIMLIGMNAPKLSRVPVASTKANNHNGVCFDPEPGDEVLVSFINGNFSQPVVIGYLFPFDMDDTGMEPPTAAAPRYRKQWQGTTETIEKNGRRTVHVAENDILDVVGNGTVTIGGNLNITVTGNATVTVTGDTTVTGTGNVTIDGKAATTIKAATTLTLDAPLTVITGTLTGTGTAAPGNASFNGNVSDIFRSMAADRGIYNSHTHGGVQTGSGTTGTPNQTE